MKKKIFLIPTSLLAVSLALVGCGPTATGNVFTPIDITPFSIEKKDGTSSVNFRAATMAPVDLVQLRGHENGCPSRGNINVLVIPVEFSDAKAADKGYTIQALKDAFQNPTSDSMTYYSLRDYFNKSSYGQLNINFDVLDKWYSPSHPSTYYTTGEGSKFKLGYNELQNGEQIVMEEILTKLDKEKKDLKQYDSDHNGTIDAVIMINTLDVNPYDDSYMYWAFRFYNYYCKNYNVETGDIDYYQHGSGKTKLYAYDYLWASYGFLLEHVVSYDDNGETKYKYSYENDGTVSPTDTYTYTHEFSHVLGAEDYYDTSYNQEKIDGTSGPLYGADMMDARTGDHNPFTKIEYGWVTESNEVTAKEEMDIELKPFESTGDTLIIANNYDYLFGAYQEYYIVSYYTNTGLNKKGEDNGIGLLGRDGIVVYHVNAKCNSSSNGSYSFAYNNAQTLSKDAEGNEYLVDKSNLIEFIKCTSNEESTITYVEGDSLDPTIKTDSKKKIPYTFTVKSLDKDKAVLTFTPNK